jgi:hypothetical protein
MDKQLEDEAQDKSQAWEERILCSDESCIGVIGPDGRCKECGKPYEGPLPLPSMPRPAARASDDYDANDDLPADDEKEDGEEAAAEIADDEWQARKLCRDESCIGVIGPDGRCKECGKPYDA